MAVRLSFNGVEYDLPDISTITFKEGRTVRTVTGLRVAGILDGLSGDDPDPDALLGLLLIAMLRENASFDPRSFDDLDITSITVVTDPEDQAEPDAGAVPLDKTPPKPARRSRAKPKPS